MDLQKFVSLIEKNYSCTLSADKVQEISRLAYTKSFTKKDIISNIGDKDNEFMFLLSGVIRLYYVDVEGNDVTRFFSTEGDIIGGVSSSGNPFAREVLEDCEVLVVDGKKFMDIVNNDMDLLRLLNEILLKRMDYKTYRESSFLMLSATERYLNFKRMHPGLEKQVNQMHIASYLGVTPVSLSRIRRAIKENN